MAGGDATRGPLDPRTEVAAGCFVMVEPLGRPAPFPPPLRSVEACCGELGVLIGVEGMLALDAGEGKGCAVALGAAAVEALASLGPAAVHAEVLSSAATPRHAPTAAAERA